jgi:hypothetical protein
MRLGEQRKISYTPFQLRVLDGQMAGDIFYVDSGGGGADATEAGTFEQPFLTIDYAMSRVNQTGNNGDIIFVKPGHAETVTTITCDIPGVAIVGIGVGRSMPAITAGGTAVDTMNVTAANVHIENLRFVGAAAATSHINLAATATDFECVDCVIEHGAAPLVAVTIVAAADRPTFDGCQFIGTADGPDVAIDFEGEVDNWKVVNCTFNYSPNGIDAACIRADAQVVPGGLVDNCRFICVSAPFIDFDSSDSLSGDGLLSNIVATIGPTTTPADIDTAIDQGGYVNVNVLVSKAVTDSGSRIPVATGA